MDDQSSLCAPLCSCSIPRCVAGPSVVFVEPEGLSYATSWPTLGDCSDGLGPEEGPFNRLHQGRSSNLLESPPNDVVLLPSRDRALGANRWKFRR